MNKAKVILGVVFAAGVLAGCGDSAVSRVPSEPEIQQAKTSRIDEINKLNIPEEQKQKMRDAINGKNPGAPPSDVTGR